MQLGERLKAVGWRGSAAGLGLLLALCAPLRAADAKIGQGIRKGSLILRPGVFAEVRYDSNVFRNSTADEGASVESAPILRLQPELGFATTGGSKLTLSGKASLDLRQYIHDKESVKSQSRFGAHLDLDAVAGGEGAVALEASERFHFQPEPGSNQDYLSDVPTYDRIYNTTVFTGVIRPGRGVLQIRPAYGFNTQYFLDYDLANRSTHTLSLGLNWRFLPKTAVVLDASYGWRSFAAGDLPDANPLRVRGGLRGLLTPRFALQLEGGYGNSFASEGDNFESIIGTLSGTYRFGHRATIAASYSRDFKDTTWANYYDSHLFTLNWTQQFGTSIQVRVGASYEQLLYGTFIGDATGVTFRKDVPEGTGVVRGEIYNARSDGLVRGGIDLEWHPNAWLAVGLGYQLEQRITEAGARSYTPDPDVPDPVNEAAYVKHQVFSRVGVVY